MYIRKASRTYKGKTYSNYVLVESVLTPKGPRQKIICSLGNLRPRPQAEWLELAHKLTFALSGQADLLASQSPDSELQELLAKVPSAAPPLPPASDLLTVHVDQVRTEESREAGPCPCRLPVLAASRSRRNSRSSRLRRACTTVSLRHDAQSPDSPRQRVGHAGLDSFDCAVGYFAGRFPTKCSPATVTIRPRWSKC